MAATQTSKLVTVPLDGPLTATTTPYVTGTSVLGIKYRDGVMLASDTLASYGSTKRYKSVQRLRQIGAHTVIGYSGEYSDFDYILTLLDELNTRDFAYDDNITLSPKEVYNYLSRVLYNRRNKFNPLWNNLIIGGVEDGESFLGMVNMIGLHYVDAHAATGFGNHLARPIFRAEHRDDLDEVEARALLEKCMRVLYYRDKQTINKIQIAKVTAQGVKISEPFAIQTDWSFKAFENPSSGNPGTW
eukprot:jgi/Chlat1/6138/Chrsp41S05692